MDPHLIRAVLDCPASRKRVREVILEQLWNNGNTSVPWWTGLPRDIWGKIIGLLQYDDNKMGDLLLVSKGFSALILRYFKFPADDVDMMSWLVRLTDEEQELLLYRTYGFDSIYDCVRALCHNTNVAEKIPEFILGYLGRHTPYDRQWLQLVSLAKTRRWGKLADTIMKMENPLRDGKVLFYIFNQCGFAPVDVESVPDQPESNYVRLLRTQRIPHETAVTFNDLFNLYKAYRFLGKEFYGIELPKLRRGQTMTPLTMYDKVDKKNSNTITGTHAAYFTAE